MQAFTAHTGLAVKVNSIDSANIDVISNSNNAVNH